MTTPRLPAILSRLSSDYGMLLVLLLLCAYYSYVTWQEHHPTGAGAAQEIADEVTARWPEGATVAIIAQRTREDTAFADTLRDRLTASGRKVVAVVKGEPREARLALEALAAKGAGPDVIACSDVTSRWAVVKDRAAIIPALGRTAVVAPAGYDWPSFLMPSNLRNIASQIAIIAVLAVGMTLVIITGGIDLSVGSLIALASVVTALLIRDAAAGTEATPAAMFGCCLAGVAATAAVGLASGLLVTRFAVPPFIVTLAMMFVASGLAFRITESQSVSGLPASFIWLGRGADLLGVPNQVVLMLLLYLLAHVLMTRMTLGRYIYAVGGNAEAARLSGVPVRRVLLFVYAFSGALAGLGGVMLTSQLNSGSPNYGLMYELYVIAAVVVGGTSLQGGQGHVLGTLIGALIIGVINNGLNLTGVDPNTQRIVFGGLILAAVLLDALKRGAWRLTSA
jgi:ribose transport system permease protein